jgi:GTPase
VAADPVGNVEAVRTVLGEIGAADVPELLVLNKADVDPAAASRWAERWPEAVVISAHTGEGLDDLLVVVGDRLRASTHVVELLIPYDRGDLLAAAHRAGEVVLEQPGEGGILVRGRFDEATVGRFREFLTPG